MISLRILGTPELAETGGKRLDALLNQPKRFALLAYLAVEGRGAPVPRDKVATLFWPEVDQERARGALRQSLYVLRTELGADVVNGVGSEFVEVIASQLSCDVAEFETAIAEGRSEDAIALYRGHLLDGFFVTDAPEFERWADGTRTRLRQRVLRAAQELAGRAEKSGDLDAAVRWYQVALRHGDADEPLFRKLLELLERQGNGAAAISAYDEFARRLRVDLDVDPSAETVSLVNRIRERATANVPAARPKRPAPEPFADAQLSAAPSLANTQNVSIIPPSAVPMRARTRVLAAAAAIVLAIAAWGAFGNRPASASAATSPSVAVLPFVDLSATHDQDYLSDGLTEEIITALSQVPNLHVPARTSSFVFKNAPADIGVIARKLGVSAVLEGSIRKSGQRLRITAQLIDANTGYHIWSENYDRDLADVFAVQTEISRAIASALRLQLIGAASTQFASRYSPRPAAYDSYLKGLYAWNQRNADGIKQAIADFQEAVAQDSTYATAYAGLAGALQFAPTFEVLPPEEAFPAARVAANRALKLDPDLAEAHASIGYIKMHWEHDWAGAETELRRSIAIKPGYATGYQWLRIYYLSAGRFAEALDAALQAVRLDPLSANIQAALGDTYFYTRQYAKAAPVFRTVLSLDSNNARARAGLSKAYLRTGRLGDAVREAEEAARASSGNSRFIAELGSTYAQTGRRDEAVRILETLREQSKRSYVPAYSFAFIHAALKQTDSALYWAGRMMDEHDNWAQYLALDPEFDDLRKDARFSGILRRLGVVAH